MPAAAAVIPAAPGAAAPDHRPMTMTERPSRYSRRGGSALLATLAVIAALAMLVVLVSRVVRNDQEFVLVREARLECLAWAEAGLALASHPNIKRGDPVLTWDSGNGTGYSVQIASEDARINPNLVIERGDEQLLSDLFQLWGMDMDSSSALIGAMRDWIDPDDLESLNGAEDPAYEHLGLPGVPPNRPFQSVREIRYVIGAEALDAVRPGWESVFSVRAGGTIDLFDAPADLIAAACAIPLRQAERFVELRWGEDGIPESEDDPPLNSLEECLGLLGQVGIPEDLLAQRVSVKSGLLRVASTGRVGRISRTIAAVISKGRGQPSLLWRGEVAGGGGGFLGGE
jgi:general secretion pathway protein K